MKRQHALEILDWKSRLLRRGPFHDQGLRRLHPVVAAFRLVKAMPSSQPERAELLKYGPIGYVACIEGYFRLLLEKLVNFGSPYSDNAGKLDDLRFTVEAVLAISSKKISLGEYIAHVVPLSSFEDINRVFTTILGRDFVHALKTATTYVGRDGAHTDLGGGLFTEDNLSGIKELFRLRHIFCHELAPKEPVSSKKIETYIGDAACLFIATEGLVAQLIKQVP